ncbi:ABC transporter ATP-binding protein [Pseudovibrio exalbescens]|uniref:ABC transporter ATP-binding protein n=1 Tax=Pseudovibrio exalbescens TaxID=197461 RepID=UPI000426B965|nr:ABC transporter ATP-binding protein [Pseudovibrio exalbescens]
MSRLKVSGLTVHRGQRATLRDVSFEASGGELIGVVGPNGSGKSTLMKAILGLLPHGGETTLEGDAIQTLSLNQRARKIAYLPQDREVAWGVSVEQLVALGRAPYTSAFGASNTADQQKVESAMMDMEVMDLRAQAVNRISGGELARVLMARALAQDTPFLLADEPNAGLDPAHQLHLMSILRRIVTKGQTILVSLHDLNLAVRWCSRVLVIRDGTLQADGAPKNTLTPELLASVFGIEAFCGEASQGGTVIIPVRRLDSET